MTTVEALQEWKSMINRVNYKTLSNEEFHARFKLLAHTLVEAMNKGEITYEQIEHHTSY
jgi:hypothetical protein